MRVLFLVGREIQYARNQVLLDAMRHFADVDVVARNSRPASLLANSAAIATRGAAMLARRRYDLVFVGFYGHLIVRTLAPLIRSPLLFDAFLSTYDTLCFDRQLYVPDSRIGRMAFQLDRSTGARADHVLLDTRQHVDYFVNTFGLPRTKFSAIPVGCSDTIYAPQPYAPPASGPLRVLSYSSYMPLHGIDTILRAAATLRDRDNAPDLRFRLIGDGALLPAMRALAAELALENVEFLPPVPQSQLAREIAAADICLGGHFHDSCKAGRVIPGKIYQMLAIGRPVIAADTPANRELLTAETSALMVPPSSPGALADAMQRLAADVSLRQRLADAGRALYAARAAQPVITQMVEATVRGMAGVNG